MAGLDRGVTGWLALGLLIDGPVSGYDLWRRAERSIAHFWPVTRSAFYAELPRLEERGLVSSVEVTQRGHPDKRVYAAEDAGRQAFADWLTTVDLTERPRHPQQLMLFFAAYAPREHVDRLLIGWRDQTLRQLDTCRVILTAKNIDPDAPRVQPPADPRLLTALFGFRRAQADIAFLDEIVPALLTPEPDLPVPADQLSGHG